MKDHRDIKNVFLPTIKVNTVKLKAPMIVPLGRSLMTAKNRVASDLAIGGEACRPAEVNA